jgi:glycosyltransferase involved in cell wall biosynthesis
VVPAHDEEDLLPSCLATVDLAGRMTPGVAVHMIVVADSCRDRTASLAAQAGAAVVEVTVGNVGQARLAGVRELLRHTGDLDPAAVWVATTDADTLVPPCWLSRQLRHAARGWEAVVGTVKVTDWTGYSPQVQAAFAEWYTTGARLPDAAGWHPHVHGANLGVTAAAYLAAGGFDALRTAEDHALVQALESAGRRVLRTTDVTVVTSARRDTRAQGGFGHFLARLEHGAVAGPC